MPVPPFVMVLFLLLVPLLYIVPLVLLILGLKRRRTDPVAARVYIFFAAMPFLYYGYLQISERLAVGSRSREIESWPRRPVTQDTLPKVIVVQPAGASDAANLIDEGLFEKGYGEYRGQWYVYERAKDPDCRNKKREHPWSEYSSPEQLLTSTRCVLAGKSSVPEISQPHLVLDKNPAAPPRRLSHGQFDLNTTKAIELRWSGNEGVRLIAYREDIVYYVPFFPPVLAPFGFLRNPLYSSPRPLDQPGQFIRESITSAK
jgi:hypothetical protein